MWQDIECGKARASKSALGGTGDCYFLHEFLTDAYAEYVIIMIWSATIMKWERLEKWCWRCRPESTWVLVGEAEIN
ncbi:hypothetical protein FF1_023585 [Malus domestica]